jgi:hypothetical protein
MLSLSVVGLFTKLLASSVKSQDQVSANILAQGLLEQAVRRGPDSKGHYSLSEQSKVLSSGNDSETRFSYEVNSRRMTSKTASTMGSLYEVTVGVTWWDDSTKGHGRLSTKATRTVYVKG